MLAMADAVGGVGPSVNNLVRGVTPKNVPAISESLAEDTAVLVNSSLGQRDVQDLRRNLDKLAVGVAKQCTRLPDHLREVTARTLFMTAGAMLVGPSGMVITDNLQYALKDLTSKPENITEFVGHLGEFHDTAQGEERNSRQYLELNNAVTYAATRKGVNQENSPVALFMAGALLEADQRKGFLPGSDTA
ncbi:MAG: hypothetical protein AB1758_28985 [Candidatus Eremiobacterota bacterium]